MEGEKRKKSYYNRGYSNLDTHPSTNAVERGLTLLSELNMLLSLWYSDYTERFFFNFLDEKRYQKEKKISDNAWLGKERTKELEKYENEIYYLLWWSDKHHFPYINCRGLLDEDNAVTTVWMWMFSAVLHLLVCSLTVAFCTISWQCQWALTLT